MGSNAAQPLNDFIHRTRLVFGSAFGALRSTNILLLFMVFAGLESLRNWILPQIAETMRSTGPIAAETWVGIAVFVAGGFIYAISFVVLVQVLLREEFDDFDFLKSERIIMPALNIMAGIIVLVVPFAAIVAFASWMKDYAIVSGGLIFGAMLLYVALIYFPIYILKNDVRFWTAFRQSFSATRTNLIQLFLLIGVLMTFLSMLIMGLGDNLAALSTFSTASVLVRGLFSSFMTLFWWSVIVESYKVFLD